MTDTLVVNTTEVVTIADTSVEVVSVAQQGPAGPRGIPGPTGIGGAVQYNFAWGDASPQVVIPLSSGKTIFRVDCVISTAFDGTGSTVTLGDTLDNSRLVGVDQIDLTTPGIYQTNPNVKYGTPTDINIYITPAVGNTTGSGFFLIYAEN
jgi:hypothetical protein